MIDQFSLIAIDNFRFIILLVIKNENFFKLGHVELRAGSQLHFEMSCVFLNIFSKVSFMCISLLCHVDVFGSHSKIFSVKIDETSIKLFAYLVIVCLSIAKYCWVTLFLFQSYFHSKRTVFK